MNDEKLLKRDELGSIRTEIRAGRLLVIRDTGTARPIVRGIARYLAAREARALEALDAIDGVPELCAFDGHCLTRGFLQGEPMHRALFDPKIYFKNALSLLRTIHGRGVVHNDLAKEANWICMPGNRAGIIDFQLATVGKRRNAFLRMLAREDLRHLLKHKRHYCRMLLTERQRRILNRPSMPAILWRRCVKPPYRFITRSLLGWDDRADAEERQYSGGVSRRE